MCPPLWASLAPSPGPGGGSEAEMVSQESFTFQGTPLACPRASIIPGAPNSAWVCLASISALPVLEDVFLGCASLPFGDPVSFRIF